MLALIGMGLGKGDISVRAIDFIKGCDKVYAERYTAVSDDGAIAEISASTGKSIETLQRQDFEDRVKETVRSAAHASVAILVYGDPLVATTHHIILDEAEKQNIEAKVFHSSSILSAAIGESCLDVYRFGPPVTIPYWSEKYRPTSFLDVAERNLSNNLHTMLLMDINQKERAPMKLSEALEIIRSAQGNSGKAIFQDGTSIMIMGNVGKHDQKIALTAFATAQSLVSAFEGKMLVMILPSKPNFAEEEAMSKFKNPD
ncbi:MAG: diphthine synthase [Candidatus Micrarchaeota archaeon]|nr:diphthine synthase [Candidatus Micrarchaeota archaeon]